MRFIDEAIIKISGGHGGKGCVSFRREKFIPRGGPDGGDGGKGGSIIFKASSNLSTLQDFRFKRNYQAENGHGGQGTNKAGRDGEDVVLKIPVGAIVKDAQTDEILVDFNDDGQEWVACKGGRGGKGNAHFVSSTFQAPKFAQPGEEGETKELKIELKLLADVAIVGFPNAGKSTLISRISAARPKIADYPFTTLTPNLGVVVLDETADPFVVADIPGLIEGAHKGLGLGTKFLKHIERNRVVIHLLDGGRLLKQGTAAVERMSDRYLGIREELRLFNPILIEKPEFVAINKVDVFPKGLDDESSKKLTENLEKARVLLRETIQKARPGIPLHPSEPFLISSATGEGVRELLEAVQNEVEFQKNPYKKSPKPTLPDDPVFRRD